MSASPVTPVAPPHPAPADHPATGDAQGEQSKLWCVHVQGPDTIIAQPSRELAEQRAAEWNALIAELEATSEPSEYRPTARCVVIEYPGKAERHAAQIAEHGGNPEDIC